VTNINWLKLSSDQNGLVYATYDETSVSEDELWVYVNKDGYAGFSSTLRPDRRAEYVLRRVFGPRDLRRISKLTGQLQQNQLAELLGGDGELNLEEFVFLNYQQLREPLRSLVLDPKVGTRAAQLLSVVAVPEDMTLLAKANSAVEPTDVESESITLENVHYALDSLQLDLCGKRWKRAMTLFNEKEFEGRASAVKRTMETILKSN